MRSRPIRSLAARHLARLGQVALIVPIATRVLTQLVNPTVHPVRKVLAVVVLAEAVIGSVEGVASRGSDST